MQVCCDLHDEIQRQPHVYPFIAMVEGDACLQFFQVAEKVVVCESEGFMGALLDLVCVYYTFDIVYPKPLYPVLLFIQQFIMGIKDKQPMPPSLTRTLSVLN